MNADIDILKYIEQKTTYTEFIESLNYELKKPIYYYGDHFRNAVHKKNTILRIARNIAEYLYIQSIATNKEHKKKKILSSAYYSYDDHINKLGFSVFRPPWSLKRNFESIRDAKLFFETKKIQDELKNRDFNYLISKKFEKRINQYIQLLKEIIINYSFDALIVPNDVSFFEKAAIKIFKELKKPTFLFAHGGIPNIYDGVMDNRTDYLVMWGQKQVEAYIKMGFDPNKLFNSGHPFYIKKPKSLSFSFNNILVLTKSLNGVCPLERVHLQDRGNCILYLYSIQNVLSQLGVKSVQLRPHPSENPKWYKKFIDNNFYQIDIKNLQSSLSESSLVIGPISTTFIDAMAYGVNYLIYEPIIDNKTLNGYPITPPLDGQDKRVPVANSEHNLLLFLQEKIKIDLEVFNEFSKIPIDLSFLNTLV